MRVSKLLVLMIIFGSGRIVWADLGHLAFFEDSVNFPKPQSAIPQFRSPLQLITRPSLALMQNCYFGTCLFFESSPSGDDAKLIFRKHLNKNTNWGEWNGFGPIRVSSTPKSTPQSGIFGPLGMSPEVFF